MRRVYDRVTFPVRHTILYIIVNILYIHEIYRGAGLMCARLGLNVISDQLPERPTIDMKQLSLLRILGF